MKKLWSIFFLFIFLFISLSLSATEVQFYLQAPTIKKDTYPLVVWLHGCTQTAEEFRGLSKINQNPNAQGAYILYPEQSLLRNPLRCWNWFLGENQKRSNDGEMKAIMDTIFQLTKNYPIDSNRIYVGGFSAGAVMAANMSACYPEIFRGSLMHSGVAFRAFNVLDGNMGKLILKARECSGLNPASFKLNRIFIFHGLKDPIARESFGLNTYWQMYGLLKGQGDIRLYQNPVMGHAWSGGDARYSMSFPEGESATDLFLDQI